MSDSQTQDARAEQAAEARRRKRKERAAKSRTPEPKDIVSGAGQPLDPGVRRELEERLGHDLSRVRLHTGRDAGQLTELLGADAVAVGQDVFFREGAFKPGTAEGRRLLAHELLHTVQNPHGLGTLRAGRELGAVSMPQQAIEREAEDAAQDLVSQPEGRVAEQAEVEQGQATPGWLRYATVDADQRRMEQLDPATIVDRLANIVLRSLRGDPEDRSGRVRLQLARMSPQVQDIVFDRLEKRLPTPVLNQLLEAVEETEQSGLLPLDAAAAPTAEPAVSDEVAEERALENSTEEVPDAHERAEGDGGGSLTGGEEAEQEKPSRGRKPGTEGGSGRSPAGRGATAPEQVASQDREEAGAREQDRSEARQQDKDSATREMSTASAQDDQSEAVDDEAAQDETEGREEAPQEPEQQAGSNEGPAATTNTAPAPSPVDRSGAEPGERPRTGGDSSPFRSMGDPDNEQGIDDEPLGLESDTAEDSAVSDSDEEPGEDLTRHSDTALSGEDTAVDPRLFVRRKRGAPRAPLTFSDGPSRTDEAQDPAEPETVTASAAQTDEVDTEDRAVQELMDGMTGDQDSAPDSRVGLSPAVGTAGTSPSVTGKDLDKERTDEQQEDADARRRDEEARAADGTGVGAPPPAGQPAGPERLAKADEDARTQDSGRSQADGGTTDSGSQAGTPAKNETASNTAADSESSMPTGQNEDLAEGRNTGTGTGRRVPESRPALGHGGQGGTEGSGHATSPGPEAGPDRVSAPGPGSAPRLAPGNGPSPLSTTEARTNVPRPSGAGSGGGGSASRSRSSGSKRQAARQAARNTRRGGGGGGGGSRSSSSPAPARGGGRAGSSAPARKKEAPAPDMSNATPEAGLAAAAGLKPHQMLDTLKGVNGAVGRSVDKERAALRKAPPNEQRPSGSPRTVPGGPTPAAPGAYTNAKVARTQATAGRTPEITGEQKPTGEVPGVNMPEPSWWDIAVTIGAKLLGDVLKDILPLDDLIDSILGLPTKDEGLQHAKVGDAPRLPLENDSDPQRTDEQSQKLDERKAELHRSGRQDAARPMGEDQIYPDVPRETLTGKVPGGGGRQATGGGRKMSGGVPIESASAVAEHDRSPQIQAGFTEGRQKMARERKTKDDKALADRQEHDQNLKREVDRNSGQQADARDKGRNDISGARDRWRKEQDDKTAEIDGKKGKKYDEVRKEIKDKEEQTNKDVDKRTQDDNKKISDEQARAESEAERKQQEGKDDADNWLEEALEKLKQFFEDLKNAIKSVFEKARKFVTDVIDKFKQQVFQLIDKARNWVIDKINKFADALIALGDELLADYPAMRDKWRRTIDGARDWAVEKVNQLADGLKEIAGKLLDGLCRALIAGLDLLETGLLAAVEVAEAATVGALEFGAAVVAGLGEWAAIFNDIVSDPGDWISKAGAAAETGVKEHLFTEVTTAVKAWFNQKVQEIIGIPMEDFQELLSGGVTVEQMAQMAWDEALPQLPIIIGVLVVEKVVAKLIPGAGWVMAIIDALQTAWGALSEILAAFGLFMDFLKSVKSGNGAQPFAKAVAAGVVALLELIYEFLIEGVGRFMGKVADKLGDMLKNLRKKKDKPDGSDAPPGKPDGPGKPKDQDRAPTTDDRSPDRPADRDDDRPPPSRPTSNQRSRPPTRPRPGKRSSPGKKPRPSQTTRPRKRRDDDERREDGREVNAARRRARDAERRMREKDRNDSPVRPMRKGPARDTLRKDARDRRRDGEREPEGTRHADRRTDDRSRDGGHDWKPGRSRSGRVSRARQTIKSAMARARRAARRLHGKARRRIGDRLNDRLRRLRELWRWRRDRMRDQRTRRPDRNQRDDGTELFDLPKVRYADADDGEQHTLMFHGRGRDARLYLHSVPEEAYAFLSNWREDVGKQELSPEKDDQQMYSKAAAGRLNRAKRVQRTIPERIKKADRDKYRERKKAVRIFMADFAKAARLRVYNDIPDPKWPKFDDVTSPRTDGGHLSEYLGTSAKTVFGGPGEIANKANKRQPPGWNYIDKKGLGKDSAWVKMHLLPERLGGEAKGNNLVPARGPQTNIPFRVNIEDIAYHAIPREAKIIWYKTEVRFGFSRHKDFVDFPSYIYAAYGPYEKVRGTGKDRRDWVKRGKTKEFGRNVLAPLPDEGGTLFINSAGSSIIAGMLECSTRLAGHIIDARDAAGGFKTVLSIKPILRKWKKDNEKTKGKGFMRGLEGALSKLDPLIARGKVKLIG
ncbi:DUF4157 domain-containing protein [Streptomyces sp. MJP52]|uniref:eCIS core domain-containing protein n=1 Tax=Streptomyces sp. MJP52 TaxID=2940555 RepID=UPI0024772712|nr:DUF4157 domain-containing protein [Streptomyces sp. MJP52]MDH6224162.1 hypothetical protein [Streptomyces sp. MJP52]